ncbi:MAG: hypothetical protein A2Y38_09525 [Spirochaetes bacterium GWB1_59_5]|nr:MAG: hypothetical protein A2Y38_09525 [Spirochaetes bacterium GWB1_59_5]
MSLPAGWSLEAPNKAVFQDPLKPLKTVTVTSVVIGITMTLQVTVGDNSSEATYTSGSYTSCEIPLSVVLAVFGEAIRGLV